MASGEGGEERAGRGLPTKSQAKVRFKATIALPVAGAVQTGDIGDSRSETWVTLSISSELASKGAKSWHGKKVTGCQNEPNF